MPRCEALRKYLLKGGFLWADDFWGPWAWSDFAGEIGEGAAAVAIPDSRARARSSDLPHDVRRQQGAAGAVDPVLVAVGRRRPRSSAATARVPHMAAISRSARAHHGVDVAQHRHLGFVGARGRRSAVLLQLFARGLRRRHQRRALRAVSLSMTRTLARSHLRVPARWPRTAGAQDPWFRGYGRGYNRVPPRLPKADSYDGAFSFCRGHVHERLPRAERFGLEHRLSGRRRELLDPPGGADKDARRQAADRRSQSPRRSPSPTTGCSTARISTSRTPAPPASPTPRSRSCARISSRAASSGSTTRGDRWRSRTGKSRSAACCRRRSTRSATSRRSIRSSARCSRCRRCRRFPPSATGGEAAAGPRSAAPTAPGRTSAGSATTRERLMVLMTHNTDISDAWEREGEDPQYFYSFSPNGYAVGHQRHPLRVDALNIALRHLIGGARRGIPAAHSHRRGPASRSRARRAIPLSGAAAGSTTRGSALSFHAGYRRRGCEDDGSIRRRATARPWLRRPAATLDPRRLLARFPRRYTTASDSRAVSVP